VIAEIVTNPIEIDVVVDEPVTIEHGLGRQVAGWLVIWRDTPVDLVVYDSSADTSQSLVLMPNASARVRIVLL